MKARDVVGKRVARVIQNRSWNEATRRMDVGLEAIEFEDGTKLYFVPTNDGTDNYVTGFVRKPERS